jgi:hypothetical protein
MVFLESGANRRFLQNVSPTERLSERSLTNALDQARAIAPSPSISPRATRSLPSTAATPAFYKPPPPSKTKAPWCSR